MTATSDTTKKFYEDVIRNEFPKLIEMFEKHLDFNHWGFKLTHSGVFPQCFPLIFYQSNQCKLMFSVEYERPNDSPAISISYGRLHAPVDQYIMTWNGKECYCWHHISYVLNFLDGLSPSDVSNSEFRVPGIIRKFAKTNPPHRLGQEYFVRMNAHIWDHYGQRLFDLFDLNRPDVWEEYRSFLKQYFAHRDEQRKLEGKSPSPITPPLYNVC